MAKIKRVFGIFARSVITSSSVFLRRRSYLLSARVLKDDVANHRLQYITSRVVFFKFENLEKVMDEPIVVA